MLTPRRDPRPTRFATRLAAALRPLAAIGLLGAALGCRDIERETVSLCMPEGSDCDAFLSQSTAALASVERGQPVYMAQCATCHGKDGRGMGNPARGDFTSPDWQKKWTDADLEGITTAGRGMKMPAFHLAPVELRSVVMFVRRLDSSRGQSDEKIEAPVGMGPAMPKMGGSR